MNVPTGVTIVMQLPIAQTMWDRSHVLATLVGMATEETAMVCKMNNFCLAKLYLTLY